MSTFVRMGFQTNIRSWATFSKWPWPHSMLSGTRQDYGETLLSRRSVTWPVVSEPIWRRLQNRFGHTTGSSPAQDQALQAAKFGRYSFTRSATLP